MRYACLLRTKRCVAEHRLKSSSTRPRESTALDRRFHPPTARQRDEVDSCITHCQQPAEPTCRQAPATTATGCQ